MADSSTRSLTIAASPGEIMAIIGDFAAYPDWAEAIKAVEIVESGSPYARRVRFDMDAGLVKDRYELAYDWAPDGMSVSWELVAGTIQKSQHGSYLLRPLDEAHTEVTYTLAVELTIPLVGILRRKAERTIMDTALGELKQRAESGRGR